VRQWARRGTRPRPRQPADQRYESAYLFGAICPAKGKGAALALPHADTEAMQLHLEEISRSVARGAHAVLLLDRAGWHSSGRLVVPKNITLILLPSRPPELNPVENVWQYLRANWLSNSVFDTSGLKIMSRVTASSMLNRSPAGPEVAKMSAPRTCVWIPSRRARSGLRWTLGRGHERRSRISSHDAVPLRDAQAPQLASDEFVLDGTPQGRAVLM
jgi:hypothetical protein